MKLHNFKDSLSRGKFVEEQLDILFSKWYEIETVPLQIEKEFGYDRIFFRGEHKNTVEYKADWWTFKTGNLFLETLVSGKPGWAIKTQADFIMYAVMKSDRIINDVLVIPNSFIKQNLSEWYRFPMKTIQNYGFSGEGILVPLSEFESVKRINVNYQT